MYIVRLWYFCETLSVLANLRIEKAFIGVSVSMFSAFFALEYSVCINFRIAYRFTNRECGGANRVCERVKD